MGLELTYPNPQSTLYYPHEITRQWGRNQENTTQRGLSYSCFMCMQSACDIDGDT